MQARTSTGEKGSAEPDVGGPGGSTTAGRQGSLFSLSLCRVDRIRRTFNSHSRHCRLPVVVETYTCRLEANKVLLLRQFMFVLVRAPHQDIFLNLVLRIDVVAVDLVVLIVT